MKLISHAPARSNAKAPDRRDLRRDHLAPLRRRAEPHAERSRVEGEEHADVGGADAGGVRRLTSLTSSAARAPRPPVRREERDIVRHCGDAGGRSGAARWLTTAEGAPPREVVPSRRPVRSSRVEIPAMTRRASFR